MSITLIFVLIETEAMPRLLVLEEGYTRSNGPRKETASEYGSSSVALSLMTSLEQTPTQAAGGPRLPRGLKAAAIRLSFLGPRH